MSLRVATKSGSGSKFQSFNPIPQWCSATKVCKAATKRPRRQAPTTWEEVSAIITHKFSLTFEIPVAFNCLTFIIHILKHPGAAIASITPQISTWHLRQQKRWASQEAVVIWTEAQLCGCILPFIIHFPSGLQAINEHQPQTLKAIRPQISIKSPPVLSTPTPTLFPAPPHAALCSLHCSPRRRRRPGPSHHCPALQAMKTKPQSYCNSDRWRAHPSRGACTVRYGSGITV